MEMRRVDFMKRDQRIPERTRLDLLAGQPKADVSVGPIDNLRGMRGDQNTIAELPVGGIDDEIR
jgi:hypothetical protein